MHTAVPKEVLEVYWGLNFFQARVARGHLVLLATPLCLFFVLILIFFHQLLLSEHQLALKVFHMPRALLVKERRDAGKGVIFVIASE